MDSWRWTFAKIVTVLIAIPFFLVGVVAELVEYLYYVAKGFFTAYRRSQYPQGNQRGQASKTGGSYRSKNGKEGCD